MGLEVVHDRRIPARYLATGDAIVTATNPLPILPYGNSQDQIRIGNVTGVGGWTKFGFRSGLTAASGEQTVWDTTGNFTPQSSAETWDITYNSSTDGAGTTGATVLAVYYVDSTGEHTIGVHTLGSDGSDTTSFSGFGINRIAVSSSGTADTNTNDITFAGTTSGNTSAVVSAGTGVTQQAIFTVGSNHDAIARFLYIHINKPGGGDAKVAIRGYVYNRSPADTVYEIFRTTIDTSSETTETINEPIGFNLSPTDVLYFVADTDTNSAEVVLRFSLNLYDRDYW